MDDILVPSYYIVDRTANVPETLHFLSFTPVYCVLITKQSDHELALQYHSEVLIAESEQAARELAEHINKETGRCPIILGSTMETVYANQESQEVQEIG